MNHHNIAQFCITSAGIVYKIWNGIMTSLISSFTHILKLSSTSHYITKAQKHNYESRNRFSFCFSWVKNVNVCDLEHHEQSCPPLNLFSIWSHIHMSSNVYHAAPASHIHLKRLTESTTKIKL